MSLVWEPGPNPNRDRSRDIGLVFQQKSETAAKSKQARDEAAATDEKVAEATPSNKPAKILRMRY
jgi:hypothetical protein